MPPVAPCWRTVPRASIGPMNASANRSPIHVHAAKARSNVARATRVADWASVGFVPGEVELADHAEVPGRHAAFSKLNASIAERTAGLKHRRLSRNG